MNTFAQPACLFQAELDTTYSALTYDLTWLNQYAPDSARAPIANPTTLETAAVSDCTILPIDINCGGIDILWTLDRRTLERMAANPRTPQIVLERLADHPMADIRAAVCDNSRAPLSVLKALAMDEDADVRYQLAENHSIALDLLVLLMEDANPYVANRAALTLERRQRN